MNLDYEIKDKDIDVDLRRNVVNVQGSTNQFYETIFKIDDYTPVIISGENIQISTINGSEYCLYYPPLGIKAYKLFSDYEDQGFETVTVQFTTNGIGSQPCLKFSIIYEGTLDKIHTFILRWPKSSGMPSPPVGGGGGAS
jgi:hypothetical protein